MIHFTNPTYSKSYASERLFNLLPLKIRRMITRQTRVVRISTNVYSKFNSRERVILKRSLWNVNYPVATIVLFVTHALFVEFGSQSTGDPKEEWVQS